MREVSIGELLRQARVKKGYDLEQTAQVSGVPSHYLLAMEMDQFKLLPQESVNSFIEQYAEAVDLDGVSLIHGYRNMKVSQEQGKKVTPSVVPTQEEVSVASVKVDEKKKEQLPPSPVEPEPTSAPEPKPLGQTRGSRHKEVDKKKSYLPLLSLLLLSLLILLFVGYITWQQAQKKTTSSSQPSSYSLVSSTSEQISSSSSQQETGTTPQPSLAVSGGGDSLAVSLSNPSSEVTIGFQLVEGEESWVAAYTDQLGEQGALLTADNPSYQVTLPAGTSSSLLTLGNTQGLAVTIDGQPLDLSALTSSLSYVTVTMQ